jgi:hypothetical protein
MNAPARMPDSGGFRQILPIPGYRCIIVSRLARTNEARILQQCGALSPMF